MLRVQELTKHFNRRVVLDHLTLTVNPGELYAFLGPNGAGKTTTIKMITGLLKPDKGSILINGFDLLRHPRDAKCSFGYIPDQPFIYDRLTPWEFLRFIGGLYRINPKSCDATISEWLTRFDLMPFANQLIGAFSHGMRQKVVFIAALLHNPPLLIIDEPMVGLDPKGAVILKNMLRERCQKGLTAFVSTHSLEIAEQIADRVGILYQGHLVAEGTISQLRDRVRNGKGRLEEIFLELTHSNDVIEHIQSS